MLKFIGTGSAFNAELGNTSAYMKDNGNLLLLDCGETVFSRMKELGVLDDVTNVYVAITHNHSDHVASLPTLIEYLTIFKGIVPNIILANDDSNEKQQADLKALLSSFGVEEEVDYEFTYGDMIEGVITDLQKIEMNKVKHSKKLDSYAIELYFNEFTIYYIGDHNDQSYAKKIAKKLKENDLVYTDCSLRDYEGRVHILISELNEVFNEEQRKQVTCMHFSNFATYSTAKDNGYKVAFKELDKGELLRRIADKR